MLEMKFDDVAVYSVPATIQDLDANEIEAVEGGVAPLVILAVAAVVVVGVVVGAAFIAGVIDGASGQAHQ
jgi:lactobin A/cerein 7B family class IIb bacteriocin